MQQQPTSASTSMMKTVKMTDPAKFCGGAHELEAFLGHLRNNFHVYSTQFPREELKVDYTCGLLDQWSEHSHKELRSMGDMVMNPVNWKTDLYKAEDPCLATFDEFETAIRAMYGDPDHRENTITKMVQNLYQSNDETVRAYEQRWKTMWRETGWHKCPEQ